MVSSNTIKKIAITTALFLFVALAVLFFSVHDTKSPTKWDTFEDQFPSVVRNAGLQTLGLESEASDALPLPLSLRVRNWLGRERPKVLFVSGFPDLVQHYLLLGRDGRTRIHCLVRYSGGTVAIIAIRHPKSAGADARALKEALQKRFPDEVIRLKETMDTPEAADVPAKTSSTSPIPSPASECRRA